MVSEREDAAIGALLGTFVGDALGMPFEGRLAAEIPARLEMEEARLGRGSYTDDTEMMIALAQSLVERGSVDPEHLARAFLAAFDPARGYGAGTREVFALWRRSVPLDRAAGQLFDGAGSQGNGAAMRIAPIAVRFAAAPDRLRREAERSARITHAHPLAVDAASVQAAAIAAAMRGEEVTVTARAAAATGAMRDQIGRVAQLLGERPGPPAAAAALGNSALGHLSVPLAVLAAASSPDFEHAVTFAVRCGGDADTLGAMAGAIAGARFGASSIPAPWLGALEGGARLRRHLARVALDLMAGNGRQLG